ncbi:MAG: uracil phosphoribosyltransferase [Lactobacillales bacterium]|jgi:uracil phosphoribosyltransferase|nr:uracil phosphoribosyltransferase [Lactobacillales bacterium]
MAELFELTHPLVKHKLTIIRDENTGTNQFRETVKELSTFLAYEATKNLPLQEVAINTPVTPMVARELSGPKPMIVPILRAGLGLVDGFLSLMPQAKIGHIGMRRDEETLVPESYLTKLPPEIEEREIFVIDPMLATGGSVIATIDILKERGGRNISFSCLVAVPEGIKALQEAHPDVKIYTCNIDSHLNDRGYIVPGLGDAGDRLFGTL